MDNKTLRRKQSVLRTKITERIQFIAIYVHNRNGVPKSNLIAVSTNSLANVWHKIDWSMDIPQIIEYLAQRIKWDMMRYCQDKWRKKQFNIMFPKSTEKYLL